MKRDELEMLEVNDGYDQKRYERKLKLLNVRFELAVRLAHLMDSIAVKRHQERCQILGVPLKQLEVKNVRKSKKRKS
jgi:hypothetical protein